MLPDKSSTANVVLFGLKDGLASQLGAVLSHERQAVHAHSYLSTSECLTLIEQLGADLVFCSAEPSYSVELLKALRQKNPGVAVVIVSECPEVSAWIDAIEAGASDYCAPPFRPADIQWIIETALRSRRPVS